MKLFRSQKNYAFIGIIFLVSFVMLVSFGVPHVLADTPPAGIGSLAVGTLTDILDTAMGWVATAILYVVGFLITTLVGILITIGSYNGFISSPVVVQGWSMVRDIGNMFFVLVLLIISFGTILHLEQYQMKRLLPKLILMAVLVNFSKVIAGFIIDFSQVVMLTFVSAYQQAGPGNFLHALQLDKIAQLDNGVASAFNPGGTTTASQAGVTSLNIIAGYAGAIIFSLVSLVVIIAFLLIFVVRIVALWLLIVFSPFAYVLSVVPLGQKYASQWWDMFSKYVIIGPVLAFFLWLSLATLPAISNAPLPGLSQSNTTTSTSTTPLGNIPSANITTSGEPIVILNFLIATAILMISLSFAQQIGGIAGKAAGSAYSKLTTAGSATAKAAFNGATYFPRGWGRRAGYAAGDAALSVVSRIPLVNTTAINARASLQERRKADAQKRYGGALKAMNTEQLEQAAAAKVIVPGSFLDRNPRLGRIVTATTRALRTAQGADYSTLAKAEMAKRGIFRPQLANPAIRRNMVRLNELREMRTLHPNDMDQNQRNELEMLEGGATALTTEFKRRLFNDLRRDTGHNIDYEDNDVFRHDTQNVAPTIEDWQRRDPSILPEAPRTITFGPGEGRVQHVNQQRRMRERLTSSQQAAIIKTALPNQQAFDTNMEVPAEQVGYLVRDRGLQAIDGLESREKRIAALRRVIAQPLRFGPTLLSTSDLRNNRRFSDRSFGPESGYWTTGPGRAVIQNAPQGIDRGELLEAIREATLGTQGALGGGGGGGAPPASAAFNEEQFKATQVLHNQYGDEYARKPEYIEGMKDGKNMYLTPENYREALEVKSMYDAIPLPEEIEAEAHAAKGPDDAIRQMEQAKAQNQVAFGEASFMLDASTLDLKDLGRSIGTSGADKELRDQLIPKIVDTYRNQGKDEAYLAKLEEALKMAQNISVVDRNQSYVQQMQTLAHERAEAMARTNPSFAQNVWKSLSNEERTAMTTRIKNRWGHDLKDDDVAREYYAEASANETVWGRKDGIRFTDNARRAWEANGAPTKIGLTAPADPPKPADVAHSFADAVSRAGAALTPDVVNDLTQAIQNLSDKVGLAQLAGSGKDLANTIEGVLKNHGFGNIDTAVFLKRIAENSRDTESSLRKLVNRLGDTSQTSSAENV